MGGEENLRVHPLNTFCGLSSCLRMVLASPVTLYPSSHVQILTSVVIAFRVHLTWEWPSQAGYKHGSVTEESSRREQKRSIPIQGEKVTSPTSSTPLCRDSKPAIHVHILTPGLTEVHLEFAPQSYSPQGSIAVTYK